MLSAIIIAKDEAANIADCLDSVAFADERIVVDSGSADDTVAIAQGKGARVEFHAFEGFGRQFNYALSLARCDWVFSIDADERVSPALAAELQQAMRDGKADGYEMPRLSTFCGREMRHSGWYPDYVLRLWRCGRARWTDDLVHPRPVCDGPVARLKSPLNHHPVLRMEQALRRMDHYSTLAAVDLVARGRKVSFFSGIAHGLWTFLRTYFLQAGILDGRQGFLLAVANAEGTYYKYMKAWLAARRRNAASKPGLVSVIVTTYNREDALDAVLRALARQSDSGFEVVVADDGSRPATAELVEAWKAKFGRPLAHVWHEARGFRAAEIRNRAILASRGAYCIFLDGDCIARPDFIAAHRRLAEPGRFVTGNRILLSREFTAQVLREKLSLERWSFARFVGQRLRGGINRLSALLRLPLGPLRRLRQKTWRGARSANLAIWRSDLAKVDGFDADYSGWGKEDSDIIVRLLRAGLRRKDGVFATGVLHLWHPEADRHRLAENERKLSNIIASDEIRAQRGLSALKAAAAVTAG